MFWVASQQEVELGGDESARERAVDSAGASGGALVIRVHREKIDISFGMVGQRLEIGHRSAAQTSASFGPLMS